MSQAEAVNRPEALTLREVSMFLFGFWFFLIYFVFWFVLWQLPGQLEIVIG